MGLSARERVLLTRIEEDLDRRHPELAAEFAAFDRCVAIPRPRQPAEPVHRQRRWLRATWMTAVLLALAAIMLALVPGNSASGACPPGWVTTSAADVAAERGAPPAAACAPR